MFRKKICIFMIVMMFIISSSSAFAGGGGGINMARETTQLLNHGELVTQINKMTTQISNQVTQITNQITMIQDMIHNTMRLPQQLFGNVTQIYSQIKGIMDKTRGIAYTMSNLDSEMKNRFRSYADMTTSLKTVKDFNDEYRKINNTQMETARTTLEALGVSWKQLENDDTEALRQLQNLSKTAEGRNQLQQSTNQFLSFLGEESIKLRQLVMLQTQMMTVVAEAERAEKEAAERFHKESASGMWQPDEEALSYAKIDIFEALKDK